MKERFIIQYDILPVSVNNYLRPSAIIKDDKAVIHMYETMEAKNWKKRFIAYCKREVKKQNWDMSITSDGHWYLDCIFYQSRTNQDNNNYYKVLCDSLTGTVIIDDKNVLVRTQKVMYDTKSPRFVAVLKPVEYTGIFKDEEQFNQFQNSNCFQCKKNVDKCTILKKAKMGRIQQDIGLKSGLYACEKRKT